MKKAFFLFTLITIVFCCCACDNTKDINDLYGTYTITSVKIVSLNSDIGYPSEVEKAYLGKQVILGNESCTFPDQYDYPNLVVTSIGIEIVNMDEDDKLEFEQKFGYGYIPSSESENARGKKIEIDIGDYQNPKIIRISAPDYSEDFVCYVLGDDLFYAAGFSLLKLDKQISQT